jgi:hypothetical protein
MSLSGILSRKVLTILALVVLLAAGFYLASFLPTADWYITFDPAARGIFSGLSPYRIITYIYPPWAVLPLLPIVLLPPIYAHGLMFMVSLALLAIVARHLKASPLTFVIFLFSPTAINVLLASNIDPIVISGILLPPVHGLFLLIMKPQIGFGVAVYYFVEIFKKDGIWKVFQTFAPVVIAWLVSALLFPEWIQRMIRNPQVHVVWNNSLFPYLIPLGLLLLWLAFRNKNPYFAMASSLFFAPFYNFPTYIVIQISLMHPDVEKYIRRDLLQLILAIFFWSIKFIFQIP